MRSLISVVVLSTNASAQAGPPAWKAPEPPAVRPSLPNRAEVDLDNNRIDDKLDRSLGALRRELARERVVAKREQLAAELAAPVAIETVFSEPVTQDQIDDFLALGGTIQHVFEAVSYGWTGTLPGASIDALPAAMGETLHVVVEEVEARLHMDEATRSGRVRPIWASGFAGQPNGISGTSDITVGIIDTGVDDAHTDLTGRMAFWHDYTGDNAANPADIVQHGSHVAGIAVGTGAAFGVGPGTLKYTDSGDLSSVAANQFFLNGVHFPPQFMTIQMNAAWTGGGSTLLRIAARTNGVAGGFISICNSDTLSSPIALTCQTQGNVTQIYSTALPQNSGTSIDLFGTTVSLSPYQAVGDGFNAMRGVAPGAKWAGAKVFSNAGAGDSSTIGAGVDGLVAARTAQNIKVMNLSLGLVGNPGLSTTLRAKVNTAVNNGVVVVTSAGNDGPGTALTNVVDDPGRAALAITVGATNDVNALARYSSAGFDSPGSDEDMKPDLCAPGGSDFYSKIMSVDSNDSEGNGMADRQANDYASKKGTSMAAPFVAGAAALMVDAMQKGGASWNFNSPTQPLFVKMMLSASATETNAVRENAAGSNPTLGRAATPKDIYEGYGLMNPDAAIEALSTVYSGGNLGGSTAGGTFDRRAWGRKIGITSGPAVQLNLTVPPGADFDLYVYSGTPDAKGNPVIIASSTNSGDADESLAFSPTSSEARYLFVKRVSGSGDWALSSGTAQGFCGDGDKDSGEQCDDGNQVGGDCCSASCQYEASNSPCNDGLFCTSTDRCNSTGTCSGSGNPCSTGGECNNSCSEANDNCFTPQGTTCATDSNPCTIDVCNGSGSCGHPAGNGGAACRAANGACDVAETCSGTSTSCPADVYAGTTVTCRASTGVCDPVELCAGTGPACPANVFTSSAVTCRSSAGVCDPAETCTGTSGACPNNAFTSSTTACRGSSSICDAVETCTGTSAACPADEFATSATLCRSSSSICDEAETCTGNSGSCPADEVASTSKVCRTAAGSCDVEETCTGNSTVCPADDFQTSRKVCRASASICDVEETCTGEGASCPADGVADSGAVCRPASSACDAEERCNGSSGACPTDQFQPTTIVCRDASGVCDVAERCTGTSATCPSNGFSPTSTLCRSAGGVCDSGEFCTGANASCPADTLANSTTVCRPASGGCDAAEFCTGLLPLCPADVFKLALTTCRSAASVCDAVETCTGLSASCPADGFAASNITCRSASGVCDLAETCTGTSGTCPSDAMATAAVTCRASAGVCDVAETCSGTAKTCPSNSLKADNTSCTTDDNVCTNDVCNGSSADCQHEANSAPCNDDLFCNGADTCSAKACSVHAGNPCPGADGDEDCSEACNETADACTANDPNGTSCDDGASCTTGDSCQAGVCTPDANTCGECGDGHTDSGEECDDGNQMNGDCCSSSCKISGGNGACDDGIFCNGPDHCEAGACTDHDGDPCPGPDGDGDCSETCNEADDACTADDPNGSSCNDSAFCNGSDICSAGACSFHSGDPCPGADGDGDCSETCSEAADACSGNDAAGSSCTDGDECTADDQCSGGACSGEPADLPQCTTTTTLDAPMCGDATGDDKITATDAQVSLRTAVGTGTCSLEVCDYNGDDKVTATDANFILKAAVGQPTTPNCPPPAGAAAITTTTMLE